jgi:hypothetical protein
MYPIILDTIFTNFTFTLTILDVDEIAQITPSLGLIPLLYPILNDATSTLASEYSDAFQTFKNEIAIAKKKYY